MNSNEYGQAEGLDNIDYYLDKLEYSVRHLNRYIIHLQVMEFDNDHKYKEVFDLVVMQNQCNRVKGDCINLKIAIDKYGIKND